MKNNLIKILTILIIFLIIEAPYSGYVEASPGNDKDDSKSSKSTTMDTAINSKEFLNDFNPNERNDKVNEMTGPITEVIISVVQKVLRVLKLFGGFVMVISLAIFGLYRVLSANTELTKEVGMFSEAPKNTKALMDAGRVIVIGSILVFSSASIVEFVMKLFL